LACQTDEDLPTILGYVGENSLISGSDDGHSEISTELEALRILRDSSENPSGSRARSLRTTRGPSTPCKTLDPGGVRSEERFWLGQTYHTFEMLALSVAGL